MKYLIISDTHLTDKVEKRKLKFLLNLVKNHENIIINGDFWEAKYVNTAKFLESGYQVLFDELKKRNTTYIFGNHDPKSESESVAKRVSNKQVDFIDLQTGDKLLHIEHGNRFVSPDKEGSPTWLLKYSDKLFAGIAERFFFPLTFGIIGKSWNQTTMSKIKEDQSIPANAIVVCGHTHVTLFRPEDRFIDGGKIRANMASYLIVEDGKIDLIKTRY